MKKTIITFILLFTLTACDEPLNNPYPDEQKKSDIYYTTFAERPKTLDPARAYSSNEYAFIANIYEPPLQYHYLKRPYTLIPETATDLPEIQSIRDPKTNKILETRYTIHIKPGIHYQPHPAFARDSEGHYYYQHLTEDDLNAINSLNEFHYKETRELIAADYVYQIKRLAHPDLQSPILGLMSEHIVGLSDYAKQLTQAYDVAREKHSDDFFFDLRPYKLSGVRVLDRYTYQIRIKGQYPQFIYWLAMPFFAPMPWEADQFYSQPGMHDRNITMDWYPVGTGAFMLAVNNPNRQMVMLKNPNYHGERYPLEGAEGDEAKGLLTDAGKTLPLINQFVFSLEKETIPRWTKFLQGYYDSSSIGSDSFDQAIHIDVKGRPYLTPKMQERKIKLQTTVATATYYMGFNMLDDVVGGQSLRARRLRQAISIAVDYEEFISIFLNGRGIPAQGPIPPGIFGYTATQKRKSLAFAKELMRQAAYPDGRDPKTGYSLVLHYDVPAGSGPDDKARFDWMRKQFSKLGIQLQIRSTQYNRFQEKMRTGHAQIFTWGWNADYPDPENFLFLLYGPNGKVKHAGENAANYSNPAYDRLFEQMEVLPNGEKRLKVIQKMLALLREDAPWAWGYHPKDFTLSHHWLAPIKPNLMANNTLKYQNIDPEVRARDRNAWNRPILWPLGGLFLFLIAGIVPVVFRFWRHEHQKGLH